MLPKYAECLAGLRRALERRGLLARRPRARLRGGLGRREGREAPVLRGGGVLGRVGLLFELYKIIFISSQIIWGEKKQSHVHRCFTNVCSTMYLLYSGKIRCKFMKFREREYFLQNVITLFANFLRLCRICFSFFQQQYEEKWILSL